MTDNMKAFLALASEDAALGGKLEEISAMEGDAAKAALIALAAAHGVTLTKADIAPEQSAAYELSDDELEAVSGGGPCICCMGGGGKKDKEYGDKACGCVFVGVGRDKDGNDRCLCVGGGIGDM